jgi:uncharacterized membrane protein YtjA (UPF0391 family)
MLGWSVIFFVFGLVAGILEFTVFAGTGVYTVKFLFLFLLTLSVVSLVWKNPTTVRES